MIIAVASGKGGTGKTTIATSLAVSNPDLTTTFLDCDVEAPNAHLFLKPTFSLRKEVALLIPEVDKERCNACGRCAEVCQYHAIVVLAGQALVFPKLCHGCGSCMLNCPENAIREIPDILGGLQAGKTPGGIRFARGIMNAGEPMAVPVIRQLKAWNPFPESPLTIRDVPPGTSCPVVESILGADFVLLVTEPTPFGLHDLKLAVKLVHDLGLASGVIINRDGTGFTRVDEFCQDVGIPVLMRIPLERRIAETLAEGQLLVEAFPEYLPRFQKLYTRIISMVEGSKKEIQPILTEPVT